MWRGKLGRRLIREHRAAQRLQHWILRLFMAINIDRQAGLLRDCALTVDDYDSIASSDSRDEVSSVPASSQDCPSCCFPGSPEHGRDALSLCESCSMAASCDESFLQARLEGGFESEDDVSLSSQSTNYRKSIDPNLAASTIQVSVRVLFDVCFLHRTHQILRLMHLRVFSSCELFENAMRPPVLQEHGVHMSGFEIRGF
jgi:hypothetical protein